MIFDCNCTDFDLILIWFRLDFDLILELELELVGDWWTLGVTWLDLAPLHFERIGYLSSASNFSSDFFLSSSQLEWNESNSDLEFDNQISKRSRKWKWQFRSFSSILSFSVNLVILAISVNFSQFQSIWWFWWFSSILSFSVNLVILVNFAIFGQFSDFWPFQSNFVFFGDFDDFGQFGDFGQFCHLRSI